MKQRFFSGLAVLLLSLTAQAQTEVRLAVHKSFSLPPEVLAQFERKHDAKVSVIKVGSSNEMLNKLILSRAQPIADAILECRGRIETERLLEAARQARAEGWLTTTEWRRVRKELQS